MRRHHVVFVAVFVLIAAHALAQTTTRTPKTSQTPQTGQTPQTPPSPQPPPSAPAAPRRDGQPINIRVDTTINETGGNATPVKKTVTAVAGDGYDASVREIASMTATSPGPSMGPTSLNVDASPTILPSGKIRVRVTLQYVAGQAQSTSESRVRTDIRQTLVLILDSGKPLVISEASDPVADRRVTVEVTATILK